MERHRSRLSRRQFVVGAAGLGLLAGCGRLPWQTAPSPSVPRIGYLTGELATTQVARRAALVQNLAALGYVEGHNIAIEYRYAEGQAERYDTLAAELVNLPVDVLIARGTRSTQAAQQATSTIPIVIAAAGDPVEMGAVDSLAHPGANVTGLSSLLPQLSGKRLELLTQVVPGSSAIAVLGDVSAPEVSARVERTRAAAQLLAVEVQLLAVREPSDLHGAFEAAIREHAGALIVLHNGFTLLHRAEIVELAAQNRLPAMYENNEWTQAGGLMAYGANTENIDRRVAYYVDRILKGTKPADLPVEQPMTFDFVVNLRTARELGIAFPNEIMLQVTEVIQ